MKRENVQNMYSSFEYFICGVIQGIASSVSVFGPLVRLSPPPSEKDYFFNLGDGEGICDLFDVPMISM
jgi:hypothetical protein